MSSKDIPMKKVGGVLLLASLILVLGVATSALAQTEGEITLEEEGDIKVTQTSDAVEVTQASRSVFGGGDNWRDVEVFVSVTDANGNAVSGLDENDFTITEDGVQQTLTCAEEGGAVGGRVSTSFVLDRSGSMGFGPNLQPPIELAKNASKTYVGLMGSNDEGEIISFASDITTDQNWTTNKQLLNSSIDSLIDGGSTNLWDAAIRGINSASGRVGVGGNSRSAVIVLTDGSDNLGSTTTVDPVIQTAQNEGVPVYTIGFGNPETVPLQRLANETGGQYFELPDASELDQVYQDISQGIGQEYKLCYRTSNAATDGTQRTIQVSSTAVSADGIGSYQAPNSTPPVVDFKGSYDDSDPDGLTVNFSGSDTVDTDGNIDEILWDFFNDGTIDQVGDTVNFTYPGPGEYEVRVEAVDDQGDRSVVVDKIGVGTNGTLTVSSDDPVTPGGQLQVDVDASNVGSIKVSNIPNGTDAWSVASSNNDGAFVAPDNLGDNISGKGLVTWAWANDQVTVGTNVTLNVPSSATERTYDLLVETENSRGVTQNEVLPVDVGNTGPSVDDYRDNPNDPNSDVSLSGLQDAINDFTTGSISLALLQDVIDEFIAT